MRVWRALIGLAAVALLTAAAASTASAKTVWLCFPGQHPDPCTPGFSTTVYSPRLKPIRVEHPKPDKRPTVDCFYVYPTVSGQKTGNSNLNIDPEQRSIALYQAARYSQYCRVYAPMYRQTTLAGIGTGSPPTTRPNQGLGLADVRSAFATYLAKYNRGRGFVLIGHSQGSFVLRQLIAKDVDPKPAVRHRLLSAILMGGNVLVKKGEKVGGDFKHIPACTSARQLGCVIAFSTFDQPVPNPSLFGRPTGVLGTSAPKDDVVLCTNPAALGGGTAPVIPIFPSEPFYKKSLLYAGILILGLTQPMPPTVWTTEPGSYVAHCSLANNANVLEIEARGGAKTPHPSPDPTWGLHLLDANIALGNLIGIVKSEAVAFAGAHGSRKPSHHH